MAWDRRLIFTIGTSSTTGESDTVVWNEIHHKTEFGSNLTGHGYPDPNYLDNVMRELSAQGVGEDNLKDWGGAGRSAAGHATAHPPHSEAFLTAGETFDLSAAAWTGSDGPRWLRVSPSGRWSEENNSHSFLYLSLSRSFFVATHNAAGLRPKCMWWLYIHTFVVDRYWPMPLQMARDDLTLFKMTQMLILC